MKKATLCFAFLRVCAASSMLLVQQVSVNYNHNANFSQYDTYAWGSDDKNKIQNPILAQVAQQDIEAAMQQKGLQKVPESQNPDLVLTARSEINRALEGMANDGTRQMHLLRWFCEASNEVNR